jgi:SAM-dependent methyltransferase
VIKQQVLTYSQANAIKADFRDIYNRGDPREYYSVLGGLDYVIPDIARPIFLQLAQQCAAARGRPIVILDLGCSYGVNAALMRHGLKMGHLTERYLSPEMRALRPERVAEFDARYFSGWPARRDMSFIGLDASAEAISYARRAGLLDAGIAMDLETQQLDQAGAELIAKSDLIISTGCVGYVTSRTFERLVAAISMRRKPWIASFVLRVFDYAGITETLRRHGLTTEKFQGATFVQRRFRDGLEFEETLAMLDARGVDPAGKEAEGLLHAELFVSRPHADAETLPLMDMLSLTSGIGRRYGELHRRNQRDRGSAAA